MPDVFTAPAPQTPAGERILRAAASLFYERGIQAVGVDLVAEVAGTTKKTIYDRFGSKDALVAEYLLARARGWQAHLVAANERRRPGPRRVLGVFDALETWLAGSTRGCAFVNAYAEFGDRADHPAVAIIRAEKEWMHAYFRAELDGRTGADRLAGVVRLLYEGALVTLTAGGEPGAIAAARRAVADLLGVRP